MAERLCISIMLALLEFCIVVDWVIYAHDRTMELKVNSNRSKERYLQQSSLKIEKEPSREDATFFLNKRAPWLGKWAAGRKASGPGQTSSEGIEPLNPMMQALLRPTSWGDEIRHELQHVPILENTALDMRKWIHQMPKFKALSNFL